MPTLWPLVGPVADLFVAGRSLGEWEQELGKTFEVRHPWDLLALNEELLKLGRDGGRARSSARPREPG